MCNFMKKVLKISDQYSFLKPVFEKNCVSFFEYGPLGELLCQNIVNEWNISNVVVRDVPVFPYYHLSDSENFIESVKEPFFIAKNFTQNTLPFSIASSRIPKLQPGNETLSEEQKYFRPTKTTQLKCLTFTSPAEGRQYFHFWQSQRKIWWRKFSANPGRFSLSEIKHEKNVEYTDLLAKFEWGVEQIERIRFLSDDIFENFPVEYQQSWKLPVKKKKTFPCVIESTTDLDSAAFCLLCDAFTEEVRLDTDLPRQFIKFHRRLAPYKTAFAIESTGTAHPDLKQLAEYLALNVKKAGISALYIAQLVLNPVEKMFEYYDLLGVPFVIVLKPSTLTDGIFGLRSRETTLQELLHIDQLTKHLELLLKNY